MTANGAPAARPSRRQAWGWLAAGLGAPLLSACATTPLAEKTTALDLVLDADDQINTNARGTPSPVLVRIYELKSSTAFEEASFFDLLDNDTGRLGPDLVAKREFELKPGEKRSVNRASPAATRQIGVIVGFREIAVSEWRAVADVVPDRDNAFLIKINATAVAIELQRSSRRLGLF